MKDLASYFTIIRDIKLIFFKRKWRKTNLNNQTSPETIFNTKLVTVGNYTYGKLNIKQFANTACKLKIGHFCSIAPNVTFLLSGEHDYENITTFPIESKFMSIDSSKTNGDIDIGDDVWIGYGCTILSGVSIGNGAIIGAGTVVAKDIPPYAIYAGNKIIKYRFEDNIIKELLKIDFGKLNKKMIIENNKKLTTHLNYNNIYNIIKGIPRKEENE